MHLILPFNAMTVYNVRKQQFTETIDTLTVDGSRLGPLLRPLLPRQRYPAMLHQRVGPDYVNVVVRPEIRS